ncbi:TolC family protein [Clostridium chromiireducens]|uniref:Outer membrane efflux protein n=1 Tax=Clostridium chromiireducens TaxID=225345 RepID=A0A1V4J1R4_9CLOT|nr:TolC family protein [Clostridium chromiireducens]OPJ66241.1 outer membrane efflux protein [Clostridium chromiireducens]
MRKNVNKIVAFAIGISIISGSIVPAFASDNVESTNNTTANVQIQVNGKVLLTLDDAIKAAISNSNTLALDEKKISYQDKVNDINEKIDDAKDADSDHKDYDEDINDNTLSQLKQQRDFDEDKLVQKTTTAYNNIVTSQMKIDKASKILELKKKDISNAKLKKDLGIMTSIDFDSTELQIQSLQNQQNLSINTLRDAQDSFKVLTGKDVTKFTLEQDIKYEQLKIDGSIDEYLDNAIDKYLKYSSELLKLKKDYYDDKDNQVSEEDVKKAEDKTNEAITKKPSKPANTDDLGAYMKYVDDMNQYNTNISAYTTTLSLRLAYLNSKLGVYTQETALEETKKTYKESLKTIYTNLLATEDNINYLKSSIQINNRQLSTLKLKSDLGLMTKSDYDTQVANSQDLDIQLRTAIDSYNTLKEKIQKPWLAF